ncbi:hypothetical protein NG799_19045 [Laspinema sp. D1]|uniref:Uncharacterized protein n=1 Tax=Laspinema palackyanum D2a TaxID=2953684 RepID=A0ABT2MUL3_9CYAN|nr:hypothetical protein [Laspinema sp. D2a]
MNQASQWHREKTRAGFDRCDRQLLMKWARRIPMASEESQQDSDRMRSPT